MNVVTNYNWHVEFTWKVLLDENMLMVIGVYFGLTGLIYLELVLSPS